MNDNKNHSSQQSDLEQNKRSSLQNELQKSNQGHDHEYGSYRQKIMRMWEWLVDILKSKTFLRAFSIAALIYASIKVKGLYDSTLPISDTLHLIKMGEFKKVIVGSLFLICYFKSPQQGMQYCIANRSLISEEGLAQSLHTSQTTFTSPLINETQIGYLMAAGIYSYIVYRLITNLKDMHGFKGKTKKDMIGEQKLKDFQDIGGCLTAKNALRDVIDCIKRPELYKQAGVRMPKGVLLYGPPGTGKTLIAKAAATEAGIPVIYCSGSEFVEVFVGLGAKRIRSVFDQARQQSPCMIFIDEIDAVGFSRGNNNYIMGGGHREMETTLNELLNQMDGFEENDKILVVAATNLANTLDPALQRPGRFDQKIEIKLPTLEERVDIFKIHLKNKQHSLQDKDLQLAAKYTEGCSGAEIENVVNLAALQSVRKAQSLKLTQVNLVGEEFIGYVEYFIQEKRKMNNVGMQNQQPHHYYRQ
eukprot:403365543